MGSRLLDGPTPLEYFREQVDKALEHQKLEISAFAERYLIDLLARCVRTETALPPPEPGFDETPLALLYLRALRAAAHERARLLRAMGDTALFVSGFFAESLLDRTGDLRYYHELGGSAYARLSREGERAGVAADVFSELAVRFRALADVLSEVSEASRLSSSASVLRLYQRWVETRSARAAQLLAEQGITPIDPGEGSVH